MEWVAQVSSRTPEALEQEYRDACQNGLFDYGNVLGATPGELDPDEAAEAEREFLEANASDNPCLDLLKNLAEEAQSWARQSGKAEEENGQEPEPREKEDRDRDLDGVPNREYLEILTSAKNSAEPFSTEAFGSPPRGNEKDERLPNLLSDLLTMRGEFWNKCFRFAVHLRCSPHGLDSGFLRNPLICRKASKELNWHQCLGLKDLYCFVDRPSLQNDLA